MKKKILLVLITALLCAGLIMSCGDDGGGNTYTITFNPQGGTWANAPTSGNRTVSVKEGAVITAPTEAVTKTGYTLDGWYTDVSVATTKLGTSTKASTNATYNAKWTEITFSPSGELTVGAKYDYGKDKDQPAWDLTDPDGILTGYKAGSVLRMTFTFTANKAGNGIGAIGFLTDPDDDDAIDNKYEFVVPAGTTGLTATINVPVFYALSALAAHTDETQLSVVTWANATVTSLDKVELLEPDVTSTNPTLPGKPAVPDSIEMTDCDLVEVDIDIEAGIFNKAIGKGKIKGDGFDAILDASKNAILRLYIVNLNKANRGWGIGTIGAAGIEGKAVATDFYVDVKVADVIKGLAGDATFISTNIWSECAIALIELWEPGEGFVTWPFYVVAGSEGTTLRIPTSTTIEEGKTYTVTLIVTDFVEDLEGAKLNMQVMVTDPYTALENWAGEVGTLAAGSTPQTFSKKFTSANDGVSGKTVVQYVIQNLTTLNEGSSYGIDCSITVEEFIEEPSGVDPIVLYDLGDGGFISGGAASTGITVDGNGLVLAKPGTGTTYEGTITFSTPIDLTGYTKIEITIGGVYSSFGADLASVALQTKLNFDNSKTIALNPSIKSAPGTIDFEDDWKDWNNTWAEVDTGKLNSIGFLSNYQQEGTGWQQLTNEQISDMYITKIVLK